MDNASEHSFFNAECNRVNVVMHYVIYFFSDIDAFDCFYSS